MAAPINAYRNKSIFTRNTANTADIQTLTAIPQTDKATMLSRYYLDGLFNATVENGADGVVGYCKIGSPNHSMHNTTRESNLRIYDGGDCVLFNDAGLNTLASISNLEIINNKTNNFVVKGIFKSAFYVNASSYGFDYQINGGTWLNLNFGALPANETITRQYQIQDEFTKDDQVIVRGFITNTEGTHLFGGEVTYVEVGTIQIKGAATYASQTTAAGYVTAWVTTTYIGVGTRLYNDYTLAHSLGGGYYQIVEEGRWFEIGYNPNNFMDEVIAVGVMGSYPNTDPAYTGEGGGTNTWVTIPWSFGSTISDNIACSKSNSYEIKAYTYRYSGDGKDYTSPVQNPENLATGYYTHNNNPDGMYVIKITEGVIQWEIACADAGSMG